MTWCSEGQPVHLDTSNEAQWAADRLALVVWVPERPQKRLSAARAMLNGTGQSRLLRPRSNNEQARPGLENMAPTGQHVFSAPTSVLGDVTNTTSGQQWASACVRSTAADHVVAAKQIDHPIEHRELAMTTCAVTPPSTLEEVEGDIVRAEDPQHVMEYLPDIYRHLQKEEANLLPLPAYMDRQPQVNAKMRSVLVDWLVDVHKKYKLTPETLFLAIGIVDRFLEKRATAKRNLQLVGVTALLIAAKFEELYPPQINDFVYVTDKAYTKDEVIKMEVCILTALDFKICRPTPVIFLERYQFVNGCTEAQKDLALYLLELTLVDYKMVKYAPSHLAAAAVLLSNKLIRRQPCWSHANVKHTTLTEQMLKECAKEMCCLLEQAEQNPLQAVRKKYSQLKHHAVAKLNFVPSNVSAGPLAPAPLACGIVAADSRRTTLPPRRCLPVPHAVTAPRRNSLADGAIAGPWSACATAVFDGVASGPLAAA